jgi:spermidine synthase
MKPTERLAEATAPDGTRLALLRHDGSYFLRADNVELMSTRRSNSEVQLAESACAPFVGRSGVRVLIGGLGFGFTLRATLAFLAPDAEVTVAELLQAVIDWNRNPEWKLAGDALADPRVTLRHDDVLNVLRENPESFDAIMLDVDNGAEALTTAANAALYSDNGIEATARALKPDGVLAYWSAGDDARFMKALRRNGLTPTSRKSRAHSSSGVQHTVIVARR